MPDVVANPIPLSRQLEEYEHEMRVCEQSLRRWVASGSLRQEQAVAKMAIMRATLETLRRAADAD